MSEGASVAIDLQALQVDGIAQRGIGRYTAQVAAALHRAERLQVGLLAPELPPAWGLPSQLATAGLVQWDGAAAVRAAARPDLVHLVAAPFLHVGPQDPPHLVATGHWEAAGVPRVALVYDLIPLRAPHHYLAAPGALERYEARARWVARSDLIVTISDSTRHEVIEMLGVHPDRVRVIHAGVDAYFFADPDDVDLGLFASLGIERPYVFCLGGSDSRKNLERLVAAMALVPDVDLVIAGHLTAEWRERLAVAARWAGLTNRLHLVGELTDEALRACYRRATLTVMPSLAEGFGLPILESAASGTACAASDVGATAEVSQVDDARFDPRDERSIADRIALLLADPVRRAAVLEAQRNRARELSWDAVAAQLCAAADEVVAADRPWPGRPRPRVLFVGPMAPHAGGLGRYNTRLLANLTDRADVAVATVAPPDRYTPSGVTHVDPDLIGPVWRPSSYDPVLYCLGNAEGHLAAVRLALRHPGWLMLHETGLPGILTTALAGLDDATFNRVLEGVLERIYPGRSPFALARSAGRSTVNLLEAGVRLTSILAERSAGVLVTSQAARRTLQLDLKPLLHQPPIRVLPPNFPPVDPVTPIVEPGPPQLVSFGVVSASKRFEVLVDVAHATDCRLAFVGPCPPVLKETIEEQASRLGIGDRVAVTGEVDEAGWRHWLERATIALQLRTPTSGEISGAIADTLCSGVPLITDMPSAGEYAQAARRYLPTPSTADLVGAVQELLGDNDARRAMREAALAFAAEHDYGRLAEAVLELTTS